MQSSTDLSAYERSRPLRSALDLATSVVPYLALTILMYAIYDQVSVLVILALAIPAAGFLLRTFIVFHDCGHGSFWASKRANKWCGRFCAVLVWQPFANWRHDHAVHHGSAGDIDRRGTGDVPTLTVEEYYARDWRGRLGYRLFRNPLVMFGIGPIYSLMIAPRLTPLDKRRRLRNSVLLTNLVLAGIITAVCLTLGWKEFLLIEMPAAFGAAFAGVLLFYVQHQFEDVYWETGDRWSYTEAALRGSSYLKLPKVLQFFSGNIGLHHVHHLSAKVPNYNLQAAHDENPVFHDVPVLTLRDCVRCTRLKLIDQGSGRLVTFPEARAAMQASPAAVIG